MPSALVASRRSRPMRAGHELSYTIGSVLYFTIAWSDTLESRGDPKQMRLQGADGAVHMCIAHQHHGQLALDMRKTSPLDVPDSSALSATGQQRSPLMWERPASKAATKHGS